MSIEPAKTAIAMPRIMPNTMFMFLYAGRVVSDDCIFSIIFLRSRHTGRLSDSIISARTADVTTQLTTYCADVSSGKYTLKN